MPPKPSLDKLLPPILNLLRADPPNPYSAHQKALTTTARLVRNGQPELACEILFNVARELLKAGDTASGAELGVRMIEIMGEAGVKVDDKSRASVTQLIALTPPGPWRKKLSDAAVKWSSSPDCPPGDPQLQQYLGELSFKDGNFEVAEPHLLASGTRDAARTLADMMYAWSSEGVDGPGAVGNYAVRGVLPWLAVSPPNLLAASTFLGQFLSLLSSPSSKIGSDFFIGAEGGVQLTTSSTINFLQLAVATVQRAPSPGTSPVQARGTDGGVAKEWQSLLHRYRRLAGNSGVLAQKDVHECLEAISANIFLIPQRGGNDMLQNLMGSLFGGGGGGLGALGAAR
ncbi:cytoplasm protein [Trichosporon asahii var. asahii CBS 2479]|uniref:Cytoplasm protein n=1 Tax=Trichosporon asahii var. asahii (strain ATCC 90039 / CBS 2479 / JCM 2466 / KCTC 7840 / NBRC 103889/ NCYC 2677 / UAMH 7654) TaxID=1186058 RepID=J4UFW2_TRIAS|nr:cytoplasm protein [Trichosporon asahii var. asahii CBS 2479]EJT50295.1 cytoplasm protein [Trichosporon asahii var. asahii CBS 2479]